MLPDRLAITFRTDREGDIVSLSAPLEPMAKDIVHRVTLDAEGQLVLKPDDQPAYRVAPQQGRRFRIVELEGFVVEFRGEGAIAMKATFLGLSAAMLEKKP